MGGRRDAGLRKGRAVGVGLHASQERVGSSSLEEWAGLKEWGGSGEVEIVGCRVGVGRWACEEECRCELKPGVGCGEVAACEAEKDMR